MCAQVNCLSGKDLFIFYHSNVCRLLNIVNIDTAIEEHHSSEFILFMAEHKEYWACAVQKVMFSKLHKGIFDNA